MCVSGALQAKCNSVCGRRKQLRREMEEGLHDGGIAVKVWVGQAVREHSGREMALGEA